MESKHPQQDIDRLAELVETGSVDGARLQNHLQACECTQSGRMIPLSRVREYVPLSHYTLLRWENSGRIRIYRPNARRAFVDVQELMQVWQSCVNTP